MRNLKILSLAVALSLVASTAEAGPLRWVASKVRGACGKGKAVAKKVVKAPAAAIRGGCANGQCSR